MKRIPLPHWTLDQSEQQLAENHGFQYEVVGGRFYLKRASDGARIWPHIDGFTSAFIRGGYYVKHKKFVELTRALERRFGDTDG